MAEGKCREAWAHTAAVLSLTANIHRDPKRTKAFKPSDFNPYEAAKRNAVKGKADMTILKNAFLRKGQGE